jgi:hypothetical protein
VPLGPGARLKGLAASAPPKTSIAPETTSARAGLGVQGTSGAPRALSPPGAADTQPPAVGRPQAASMRTMKLAGSASERVGALPWRAVKRRLQASASS